MNHPRPRIILIGGTSHAGKSTLAASLASALGWECWATDKLARHPGRPWRVKGKPVPEHVAAHYAHLSVEELIADVLDHYKKNVIPQVEQIVFHRCAESGAEGLILEGSALWPEFVVHLLSREVGAVWLVASDELIRARIHETSGYAEGSEEERILIHKFLERTLCYNRRMQRAIERLKLDSLNAEAASESLSEDVLARLGVQGRETEVP